MKSLTRNLLLLTAIAVFAYSCNQDDPEEMVEDPTVFVEISVNGAVATSPATVEVGDVITAEVDITAPGGFNAFRATVVQDGETLGIIDFPVSNITLESINTAILSLMTVPDSLENSSFTMDFLVVDDAGKTGTALSFDFNVESGITTNTETLLGGPSNATNGSFYDVLEDSVYSASNAFEVESQENIDLLFWYGNTSMYSIGATDDATAETAFESQASITLSNLQTRNETRFKILADGSSTEFDDVSTETELLNLTGETGITETSVKELVVDDVFAFIIDSARGGKIGAAKVIATEGVDGSTRAITILVKLQK